MSSTDVDPPQPSPPAPQGVPRPSPDERRRRSLRTTVRDMVLSMLVIVGFVGIWVLLVPRPTAVQQPAVDVVNAASGAAERLRFEPTVPQGLPADWTPTNAQVQSGEDGVATWAVAYTLPDGGTVLLKQGYRPTPRWETTQVVRGEESGTREVAGQTWVVRDREDRSTRNLVLRGADVTTVVSAFRTDASVDTLAEALDLSGGELPAG